MHAWEHPMVGCGGIPSSPGVDVGVWWGGPRDRVRGMRTSARGWTTRTSLSAWRSVGMNPLRFSIRERGLKPLDKYMGRWRCQRRGDSDRISAWQSGHPRKTIPAPQVVPIRAPEHTPGRLGQCVVPSVDPPTPHLVVGPGAWTLWVCIFVSAAGTVDDHQPSATVEQPVHGANHLDSAVVQESRMRGNHHVRLLGEAHHTRRMIESHHDFFLSPPIIMIFAARMSVRALWHPSSTKRPLPERNTHGTTIEIWWTIIPSIISMFPAIPSFASLHSMDEVVEPAPTTKAIGHQWYRSAPTAMDPVMVRWLSAILPQ